MVNTNELSTENPGDIDSFTGSKKALGASVILLPVFNLATTVAF